MADLSDVMTALANECGLALYPSGISNPVSPVNGSQTRVFPGWPAESQIDSDLAAGLVTVSIYTGKVEKNATRFLDGYIRVGSTTTLAREIRRVSREFQITVWSPDPTRRDQTAIAIDLALCELRSLTLADGSQAFIRYVRGWIDDVPQKELNYQRVLVYEVEFGNYRTETGTPVTTLVENVKGGFDPSATVRDITYTGV